jgi:hypothetical protein
MTASRTGKRVEHADQIDQIDRIDRIDRIDPTGRMDRAEPGETVDTLVLDLLEWMGSRPRRYDEVMEAWRTSCPRLMVWEDATARGYVERRSDPGLGRVVTVTAAGTAHLQQHRPGVPAGLAHS